MSRKKTFDYDPILASQECTEGGCKNLIGDFQDDLGGWSKDGDTYVCEDCWGPLIGDR